MAYFTQACPAKKIPLQEKNHKKLFQVLYTKHALILRQGNWESQILLRVYELFDQKIVYNSDTYQLFYDALQRLKTWTLEDQYAFMDFVKEKHVYLNRIRTILQFLELCQGN